MEKFLYTLFDRSFVTAKALSTLRGALFFLIRCREEHAQTPIHCVTPKPVHADDKSMHGIEDPQNRDCQELQYDFEVKWFYSYSQRLMESDEPLFLSKRFVLVKFVLWRLVMLAP